MMARSTTRSNHRPDTLMQDRLPPDRQRLLQRTAGPYIATHGRTIHVGQTRRFEAAPSTSALPPTPDILLSCSERRSEPKRTWRLEFVMSAFYDLKLRYSSARRALGCRTGFI